MSNSILIAGAAATDLAPAPITSDWILSGKPEARNKVLTKSHDRTSYVMVWECTPGLFNWNYTQDETVVVISGEVFITDQSGNERRLAAGDLAFFPAGSRATWRVTERIRKVAVMRESMPRPFALFVKVWNKVRGLFAAKGPALVWAK
jgi:uncharacterized cupin superfamily protein